MPEVESEVGDALVRRLLATQYARVDPRRAAAPITEFSRGWDNVMFRLGNDLLVRLPVRQLSAPLIDNEARWLPVIGPELPIATPQLIFTGRPGHGYPWTWTVQSWIEGEPLALLPVARRDRIAARLAETFLALHTVADPEAPTHPTRGVPLSDRESAIEQRRPAVAAHLGRAATELLYDTFHTGAAADRWPGEPVWIHGDPHPFNLLQHDDALVGMIDFGDVTAGDPSTDLATAWWSLDARGRHTLIELIMASGRYDDAIWLRAKGWAASFVTAVATDPETREQFAPVIEHTLIALADPA